MNLQGASLSDVFGDAACDEGGGGGGGESSTQDSVDPRPSPFEESGGGGPQYLPRDSMMATSRRSDATTMQMSGVEPQHNDAKVGPNEGPSINLSDVVHQQGGMDAPLHSRMMQPGHRQTHVAPPAAPPQQTQQPVADQQQPPVVTMDQVMQWVVEALTQGHVVTVEHPKGRSVMRAFVVAGQPDPVISVSNAGYGLNVHVLAQDRTALTYHLVLAVGPMVYLRGVQIGDRTFIPGNAILPPNNEVELMTAAMEALGVEDPNKPKQGTGLSGVWHRMRDTLPPFMQRGWVMGVIAAVAAAVVALCIYKWMSSRKGRARIAPPAAAARELPPTIEDVLDSGE